MPENPFGAGNQAQQFLMWQVAAQIAATVLLPVMRQVQSDVWSKDPDVPISPPILADMVNRGIIDFATAVTEAAKNGTSQDQMTLMKDAAGEPPGLQTVLEYWRRGFIPWGESTDNTASVMNAIAKGRVYTYWADAIQKAHFAPPSVAEAVNAVLRHQVSEEDGQIMAYFAGLGVNDLKYPPGADPTDTNRAFQILLDTAGRPPSPTELMNFVRRGFIPIGDPSQVDASALTFYQGIFEGDSKDKWAPIYEKYIEAIPSIYEIRTLLEHGAISVEQATQWLADEGYPTAVAQGLANDATAQSIVTDRQETETTITTLYQSKFMDRSQAMTYLEDLGYASASADFILAAADMKYALSALNSAVTKIGTYFIDKKITSAEAQTSLSELGLNQSQISDLLQTWTIEQTSNVKLLTESQIADAWEYGVMDRSQAQTALEALGYTPFDAYVVLSVKNKAPLPNPPAGA